MHQVQFKEHILESQLLLLDCRLYMGTVYLSDWLLRSYALWIKQDLGAQFIVPPQLTLNGVVYFVCRSWLVGNQAQLTLLDWLRISQPSEWCHAFLIVVKIEYELSYEQC